MELLGSLLIAVAAVHVVALGAFAGPGHSTRGPRRLRLWCACAAVLGFAVSTRIDPPRVAAVGVVAVTATCAVYAVVRRHELEFDGALTWISLLLLSAFGSVRAVAFIAQMDVSALTRGLLWIGALFVGIGLPASIITQRESLEVLIRRRWRHQHDPFIEPDREQFPFVSIQVPCHAEPPEMVTSTLDRLAELDYPAFEVLVIDNNTTDPDLWRPVESHCRELGPRFRFLHIEGLDGAKAGALNWAFPHIDARAEFVALVDSDYHVDPNWLRATIGFLDDEEVAFVQPPTPTAIGKPVDSGAWPTGNIRCSSPPEWSRCKNTKQASPWAQCR